MHSGTTQTEMLEFGAEKGLLQERSKEHDGWLRTPCFQGRVLKGNIWSRRCKDVTFFWLADGEVTGRRLQSPNLLVPTCLGSVYLWSACTHCSPPGWGSSFLQDSSKIRIRLLSIPFREELGVLSLCCLVNAWVCSLELTEGLKESLNFFFLPTNNMEHRGVLVPRRPPLSFLSFFLTKSQVWAWRNAFPQTENSGQFCMQNQKWTTAAGKSSNRSNPAEP